MPTKLMLVGHAQNIVYRIIFVPNYFADGKINVDPTGPGTSLSIEQLAILCEMEINFLLYFREYHAYIQLANTI